MRVPSFRPPAGATTFDHEFSPLNGVVAPVEKPQRDEICLNGLWEFQAVPIPDGWAAGSGSLPDLRAPRADGWDDVPIKIPSPWNVNGYQRSDGPDHHDFPSYPDAWEDCRMAWMRRSVMIPAGWRGKQIVLHFEAVAGFTQVLVNGAKLHENIDLFLPFDVDITGHAAAGEDVEILVGVRHHELANDDSPTGRRVLPAGSMWGKYIAGIWQDVYLLARPKVRIDDIYVRPLVSRNSLEFDLTVANDTDDCVTVGIAGTIREWRNLSGAAVLDAPVPNWELGDVVLAVPGMQVDVPPQTTERLTLAVPVDGQLKYWSPDSPNLYGATLSATSSGDIIDCRYQRFGWREWTIDGPRMLLNGEPMELRGDSWHFQGVPQMTRRYAWAWYTAIKDANGNAVRPHAQVYPRFYMELADEMGICVLAETANWASDGGPRFDKQAFWDASDDHLRRLVLRDRNFPCVFGWSLTNENRPIIMNVFKRPELMPVQVEAWKRWVGMCRELDPSRPWISGDGDDDGDGTLPVVVGHYGDEGSMKQWSSKGKPWGVGEHSMAYYGTPKQVAKYNQDRAYESVQGRMEGLAYECYDLLAMQRKFGATYVSVFNLAWYSLQPLALGLADTTRPPTTEDGIFLTQPYVEGKPGIQPERLGPYCSTFNPGYDPSLPLYKPWPMFEAIKQANAPDGPAPSTWATMPVRKKRVAVAPEASYDSVVFLGAHDSPLQHQLAARGLVVSTELVGRSLTIVDGHSLISQQACSELKQRLETGNDVWIWGITAETAKSLNKVLPHAVEVTERDATSLLVKSDAQIVSGMSHADFYFSEIQKTPAMVHGLAGPFVENGQVILAACDANWLRWNKVSESIKTAALLRTEREAKSPGAALVQANVGAGHVMINTMTTFYQTDEGFATLQAMLRNMGVPMHKVETDANSVLDLDGNVRKARVSLDGNDWATMEAGEDNTFAFGPQTAVVGLCFWLWSPRPLDDLLIEPNMPHMDLITVSDADHEVILNGVPCSRDNTTLLLKQGWNQIEIQFRKGQNATRLTARLKCSDCRFMSQIKSAVESPDEA